MQLGLCFIIDLEFFLSDLDLVNLTSDGLYQDPGASVTTVTTESSSGTGGAQQTTTRRTVTKVTKTSSQVQAQSDPYMTWACRP